MSTIFNNTSTSSTASTGVAKASTEMSDMFTKLLVAQIQNQDPLSPTDPSQFVNQLAQLSQTESMQTLANLTSASNSVLQSMQVLAMGAQVGSEVMVNTGTVQLGTEKVSGSIALTAASATTTLVLTGSDGQKHNIKLGTLSPGTVPISIDPTALGLPAGSYSMSVQTTSGETATVDIAGKLNSVRLGAGGSVVLNVGNVGEVATTAVTGFNGTTSKTAAAASSTNTI